MKLLKLTSKTKFIIYVFYHPSPSLQHALQQSQHALPEFPLKAFESFPLKANLSCRTLPLAYFQRSLILDSLRMNLSMVFRKSQKISLNSQIQLHAPEKPFDVWGRILVFLHLQQFFALLSTRKTVQCIRMLKENKWGSKESSELSIIRQEIFIGCPKLGKKITYIYFL